MLLPNPGLPPERLGCCMNAISMFWIKLSSYARSCLSLLHRQPLSRTRQVGSTAGGCWQYTEGQGKIRETSQHPIHPTSRTHLLNISSRDATSARKAALVLSSSLCFACNSETSSLGAIHALACCASSSLSAVRRLTRAARCRNPLQHPHQNAPRVGRWARDRHSAMLPMPLARPVDGAVTHSTLVSTALRKASRLLFSLHRI
jgi:hypothetical protein